MSDENPMDIESCADALKELGHPSRLKVYKHLVKAGREGLPVGTLQKELNIPSSTLSHHIAALVKTRLVRQQRDGRTLYCIAQFEEFDKVLRFLWDECCLDECACNDEGTAPLSDAKGAV